VLERLLDATRLDLDYTVACIADVDCYMQAMARVWRDGQRRRTYVYRLLAAGSIEEKIFQRQVNKQGLTGAVVDARTGDGQMPAFDAEQLRRLFCLNERTLCETHDLLDCDCIAGVSAAKPESVARENVRDCQLNIHGAAYSTAVSAMCTRFCSNCHWHNQLFCVVCCITFSVPHVGPGHPFFPCPFTFSFFALLYFFIFSVALTIFFFCPSLSFLPE